MKRFLLSYVLCLTSFVSFAQDFEIHRPVHELRGVTHSLRSDTIDILHYDIHLYVPVSSGNITGYTSAKFSPKMNGINSVSFDLLKMTIDSVKIGNSVLSYTYDDTLLVSFFPTTMNDSDTSEIFIYYHGIPQMDPSSWGGWYFNSGYSFNLGVGFASIPHNFGRVWHPCFDNFMEHASYDFYISSSASNFAYCNGYLVSDTFDLSGNRVRHWKMETPITSYLASVAVSAYTHVNQIYISTVTGDTIPVQLAAQPVDTTAFKAAAINLPYAIEAYEEGYGAHFFNKIGYVSVPFSSGAMEHATNIAYPKAFLGNTFYESVLVHELAHHWWGDLVTCKTAEDMWINEGMATYSEKLFFENRYGKVKYKSEVRNNHKSTVWKHHIDDGGYWALSGVPQDVTYGTTSYSKGSDVAHTLRGYLGDSLFFLGLKTVIANNQLQNINSDDFRDELNTVSGINVTDFFADWVNTPGYPQFSIDSFITVASGGDFDVTVYVHQRLRGRTTFSNNVPITVTFRDDNWNVHSEKIYSSGQYSNTTFTVPFSPTFVTLNDDEKISDATTAEEMVIKTASTKSFAYANFSLPVTSITDSAFIRAEHYWVMPDQNPADPAIVVSPDRYWKIHGTQLSNISFGANFSFNGTNAGAGYLDDGLMVNHGAVAFHEDSLVLLYRAKTSDAWSIHPTFTINTQGDPLNKVGVINATNAVAGEYCLGIRAYGVGINEKTKTDIKLFPNPNDGIFRVDMGKSEKGEYVFSLYNLAGSLVTEKISSEKEIIFSSDNLANGNYILSIKNKKKLVANMPVVVVR
jgi:aminopeptidase N